MADRRDSRIDRTDDWREQDVTGSIVITHIFPEWPYPTNAKAFLAYLNGGAEVYDVLLARKLLADFATHPDADLMPETIKRSLRVLVGFAGLND